MGEKDRNESSSENVLEMRRAKEESIEGRLYLDLLSELRFWHLKKKEKKKRYN